jgi:uncharacterized cupin superfamily protein
MIIVNNIKRLVHEQLTVNSTAEKLSLSIVLSSIFGFRNIFVVHEVLKPGCRDSLPHSHSKKEEMIFILEGQPTLHIGDQTRELVPGDFVGLQPNTELHYLENLTETSASFLKICSNPMDDKINF